jgi:hypothetical protein
MKERRGARRISTNLTARWDIPIPPREGKIVDLSIGGCFILTASRVSVNKLSRVDQTSGNEAMLIEVQLPHGERLELRAELVYKVERVGFAARFVGLTAQEEQTLQSFIEQQEPSRAGTLPFRTAGRNHRS